VRGKLGCLLLLRVRLCREASYQRPETEPPRQELKIATNCRLKLISSIPTRYPMTPMSRCPRTHPGTAMDERRPLQNPPASRCAAVAHGPRGDVGGCRRYSPRESCKGIPPRWDKGSMIWSSKGGFESCIFAELSLSRLLYA